MERIHSCRKPTGLATLRVSSLRCFFSKGWSGWSEDIFVSEIMVCCYVSRKSHLHCVFSFFDAKASHISLGPTYERNKDRLFQPSFFWNKDKESWYEDWLQSALDLRWNCFYGNNMVPRSCIWGPWKVDKNNKRQRRHLRQRRLNRGDVLEQAKTTDTIAKWKKVTKKQGRSLHGWPDYMEHIYTQFVAGGSETER